MAEAIATAMAAEDAFGPAPRLGPEPGLTELAQGEWEGLTHTQIRERYGAVLGAWRRQPLETWAPGGESLRDADARVRPALERILGRLAEGGAPGTHDRSGVPGPRDPLPEHRWAVLVGHDGIFKVLFLALFNLSLERFWSFPFVLCGITIIELRAGRATLRAHNLTDHLAPLVDDVARATVDERSASGAL